jgi:hypothetical protein
MGYLIRLHDRVARQIARWGLSEYLLVEVYLALREELGANPSQHLAVDPDTAQGMLYAFARRDPDSPRFQHIFMFRVLYEQNETHLFVFRGSYWRTLAI